MRVERSKNALNNAKYGILNKIVGILLPFAVRTVFIHTLGAEYLGLNSLFTSILTVLNLTEMGFSSAVVFSMYKPIAENDTETINALLRFYRKAYRIVGIVVLGIGLVLLPFLPKLINESYPEDINIYVIYLIMLANTSVSYFLYAYRGSLITAHQREDVISKINIVISIAMYACQLAVIVLFRNYYLYILLMPVFTVVNNIRTAIVTKKLFPNYHPVGELGKEQRAVIREKIGGLMLSKISNTMRNSLDSIFISMYLGLVETAIYNNYYYIMNAISALVIILPQSVTAGVGNSTVLDSEEKNHSDMNRMNFLYMWLCSWCTVCLLCLFQPLMHVWVGPELTFPFPTVMMLCAYFFLLRRGDIISIYTAANGLWWQLRFRTIMETVMNILLNWLLGKYFGVNGIIAATLITVFVFAFLMGTPIIYHSAFPHQSVWKYFLSIGLYAAVTAVAATATYFVCLPVAIGGMWELVLKAAICLIVPNAVWFLIFFRTKRFRDCTSWFLPKVRKNLFRKTHSA